MSCCRALEVGGFLAFKGTEITHFGPPVPVMCRLRLPQPK
ncbi:hypothetical protein HMPREF1868_01895 [Olsenella sp. DNF00959]|nr:hypothetical protein HMPREF1868_01895 [Olsenella sp. DNF00959]